MSVNPTPIKHHLEDFSAQGIAKPEQPNQKPSSRLNSEIPIISLSTLGVFRSLHTTTLSSSITYPLKERVDSLETLKGKLQNAETNSTRNKIFGVLKAALHVAIVVGGILGSIALKPVLDHIMTF